MKRRNYPEPILDAREQALIAELQREFEAFTKPGVIKRGLSKLTDSVGRTVPDVLKRTLSNTSASVSEWELIQKTLEIAEKGFHLLTQQASRLTVSKLGVMEKLSARGTKISRFEQVCLMRSYDIEAVIEDKTYQDILLAAIEGAATGFFGFPGLPFNWR